MFDSINHLLKHKEKLNVLLDKLNLHIKIKDLEIEYLEQFCSVMKPIACAMHCQNIPTAAFVVYETFLSVVVTQERK